MPPVDDDFSKRLSEALNGRNGSGRPEAAKTQAASEPAATVAASKGQPAETVDAGPVGTGEHVVRAGECISSIAKTVGHFWHTIWDDAGNAALRAARQQPNVLLPGDRVVVPPLRRKDEPGETEMRHRFVRRGEPAHFAVRVLEQDVPRGNEPFTLVVDGGPPITGTTDPEGKLDVPISGNARQAVLTVGAAEDALQLTFNLGGLAPVASWEGVQARLRNLGFSCDETGACDEQTIDALNAFRASVELPTSDAIDEATRAELLQKHGS